MFHFKGVSDFWQACTCATGGTVYRGQTALNDVYRQGTRDKHREGKKTDVMKLFSYRGLAVYSLSLHCAISYLLAFLSSSYTISILLLSPITSYDRACQLTKATTSKSTILSAHNRKDHGGLLLSSFPNSWVPFIYRSLQSRHIRRRTPHISAGIAFTRPSRRYSYGPIPDLLPL